LKRIWSFECRESSLQSNGEDRLRRELKESVVLVPELLNQNGPPVLVKQLFIWGELSGDWESQQSHAVLHIGQLVVFIGRKIFSGVSEKKYTFININTNQL